MVQEGISAKLLDCTHIVASLRICKIAAWGSNLQLEVLSIRPAVRKQKKEGMLR